MIRLQRPRIPPCSPRTLGLIGLGTLFAVSFTVPFILVNQPGQAKSAMVIQAATEEGQTAAAVQQPLDPGPAVTVFRTALNQSEQVLLEHYVQGVVAAEMPADFELEALKAQAIAARTYIVKRLAEGKAKDITDTVKHQAYVSFEDYRRASPANARKIEQAVNDTHNRILTYQGHPIEASFFSTSNGFTENSEEYWTFSLPYLRSVPSPWDAESPKYTSSTRLTLDSLAAKLGLNDEAKSVLARQGAIVTAHTGGNRVGTVKLGSRTFTGREVREKLGLPSSSFTITVSGSEVTIACTGYGHGIGMSQYGANGMAKEGKRAEDILFYYYKGTKLEEAKPFWSSVKSL